MSFCKNLIIPVICFLGISTAQATTFTAATNIDNGYEMFLSTDDSVTGSLFGSGLNWPNTFTDTTTLSSGVTNFVHIRAYDIGGIAMFLGEFTLSDSNFQFANGTQSMLTGDAGILVSETGFGSGYSATSDLGINGTSPWGLRTGVDSTARFVWSDDAYNDNEVFFSFAINAVSTPEPSMLALLGLGVVLIGFSRRVK